MQLVYHTVAQWVVIALLCGWCGYLQYKQIEQDDPKTQSPASVVQRLASVESTIQTSFQVTVNSFSQLAFMDEQGFGNYRVYIPLDASPTTLPTAFNESRLVGNLSMEELLERSVYAFLQPNEETNVPIAAYFMSTDLRLMCGYRPGDMFAANREPWCAATPNPSCSYMNMIAVRPDPFTSITLLLTLASSACANAQ